MDLSKIPEPSEEDLARAEFFAQDYEYLDLSPDEQCLTRVIARTLRHGGVLAQSMNSRAETANYMIGYAGGTSGWVEDTVEESEAISFFEKFGGEA